MTFEELSMRGYITKNINTHFVTLNSAKATAFHSPGKCNVDLILYILIGNRQVDMSNRFHIL